MENKLNAPESIDAYIAQFPPDIQELLQQIRAVIRQTAPQATEKISYQMPTFYLNGNLVHFAKQKNHIGFYPGPAGIENYTEALKAYKTSKGAIQFPLDKPIPFDLIRAIVAFRVQQNQAAKKPKKRSSG